MVQAHIVHFALGVCLCSIGNRASGQKGFGGDFGIPLMAMGLWMQYSLPLWGLAIIVPLVLNFRLWSTHPWFAVFEQHKWAASFLRGAAVLPLAFSLSYLQWHSHLALWWTPAATGIVSVFMFAVDYWLGARIAVWTSKTKYPVETVAAAELLAGVNLGIIGL